MTFVTVVQNKARKIFPCLVICLLSIFCCEQQKVQADSSSTVSWQEDRIIVNHSLEDVQKVLESCQDYNHLFKRITRARKLSRSQCYLEAVLLRHMFWVKAVVEKPRVDADGKTVRLAVRMLEGNLKVFSVKVVMIKLNNKKTQVTLHILADPGITGVPDVFIENGIKNSTHEALVSLRRRLLLGRY